jgi:hypothetical protein
VLVFFSGQPRICDARPRHGGNYAAVGSQDREVAKPPADLVSKVSRQKFNRTAVSGLQVEGDQVEVRIQEPEAFDDGHPGRLERRG